VSENRVIPSKVAEHAFCNHLRSTFSATKRQAAYELKSPGYSSASRSLSSDGAKNFSVGLALSHNKRLHFQTTLIMTSLKDHILSSF
jgi:hypothetical protein